MDPLTATFLFVMAVLLLLRRGAEDITAMVTGRETPRLVRMRERRALDRLTITEAIGVRIARRIAQGRDPNRRLGPMRLYLAELWAHSWEDVRSSHEAKRRGRPNADPQPCSPDPNDNADVLDAEVVDTEVEFADWVWPDEYEPPLTEPPGPDPVQESARKEPSMPTQSSTVTVPGEASSPVQALAWADSRHDANLNVMTQLQYLTAFLKGKGLGPAAIATVGAVYAAVDAATGAIQNAQGIYAEHVLAQQELTSDPALRDTLVGYLDASRS
jgi:hypothetical protein